MRSPVPVPVLAPVAAPILIPVIILALALLALAGGPARALETVRFGTNWVAEAEHGGFYQAVADGTYRACGLDVEIVPGGPQVNNRALMLAGRLDFHLGVNMLEAFAALEQDIPLKVVAAMFQKDPQVMLSHPGAGHDSWESLVDAPILIGDLGYHSFFQWMVAAHGFKPENRRVYTFSPAPFLADKRMVMQGYATAEPFLVEREGGFKPNVFLLADHGFDAYSTTIETMQETIDRRPEVVKCFVEGSAIGWATYLHGDPSAGNALIRAHNPDMSDAQIAYARDAMRTRGIVDSGDAETLGIGAMTDARQKSFYDRMVAAGVVREGLDVTRAYTLRFANGGAALAVSKALLDQKASPDDKGPDDKSRIGK